MDMRFDQEMLGRPLLTRVHQAARTGETLGMEAGAQAVRPVQGHLKIVSGRLNIGNAVFWCGF
ncbi:hypothetical protein GCM10009804_38560 [Kribbella hippodromi]|uniref:Uncharacterized protein n=1 Tax=Kribbella hippodromi TaxID=434347 RepID=A0ABN2DIR3_9ACTN